MWPFDYFKKKREREAARQRLEREAVEAQAAYAKSRQTFRDELDRVQKKGPSRPAPSARPATRAAFEQSESRLGRSQREIPEVNIYHYPDSNSRQDGDNLVMVVVIDTAARAAAQAYCAPAEETRAYCAPSYDPPSYDSPSCSPSSDSGSSDSGGGGCGGGD